MIRIEVIDEARNHFVIVADEPARVEFSASADHVVAHGYLGADGDLEQEPDVVYDSANDENRSFERHGRRDGGFEAIELPRPEHA